MLTAVKRSLRHVISSHIKIANGTFKSIHTQSSHNSPLEGVRVLDLTRIVAGPYCTMILSDLGAEVIKVERPGSGDEARKWGPPFVNKTPETSYFIALNRNKKSVCIDLKSPKGKHILYELAKTSDVLVENYVPGKLCELELGYEHLRQVAPHLIYCSITGFGPEGPYQSKPGYDVVAASMGGFLHITGPKGGEPCKAGVAMTDLSTGLYAHGAILAALFKRTKTGKGQKIDCNLLSTQVASLINIGSNYLNTGKEAARWGTAHESIVPYEAFPTKDGYFTIGAGSDLQFKDLCKRMGRQDLADNEKFKTNQLRVQHRIELIGTIRSIIATKTKKEWAKIFEGGSFPNGPVNTLQETFDDPHIEEIGLIHSMEHPVAGSIKVVGPPVKYSDGGNCVRSAPPTLGQHTDEVLKNLLQYNQEQLKELRQQNVIQ
ncbi:succinate--hydroxymethylglutarate CoA-transferase [Zophobas morio]|uniref:succinate--hydroxymethylglutarate CoA-transferase n=1 Tax=Zophobas morio TaxID=2755281 RepID=UPI0030832DE1